MIVNLSGRAGRLIVMSLTLVERDEEEEEEEEEEQ